MRSRWRFVRRFLLLTVAWGGLASGAGAETIAIRAGWLVDPEARTAARDQVILVEDGKIAAVGPGLALPDGARVIDLSTTTLSPGLFDCHTHLCAVIGQVTGQSPRDIWAALLQVVASETTGFRAIRGVAAARAMLEAGFTTVRDVGNAALYADTDLRRAIEEGLVPGPTVINAGRIIAPVGGQFPSRLPPLFQLLLRADPARFIGVLPPERPDLGTPEYFYADTRDELKKAIRENILYGARVIKVVVDDQPYIYSADDLRFVVEESGRAGLRVAAHCLTDEGARNAAEAGVASIEHGFLASEETLALAKRNGVVLVGTDFPPAAAEVIGMPPEFQTLVAERLRRALRVGVPMAFGTDIFFAPPGYTHGSLAISYLGIYRDAGMSPGEILAMMTTSAARLLGIEAQRGAIRPGLAADLIGTPASPLEDIGALREVVFVMKDGRVIKGPGME